MKETPTPTLRTKRLYKIETVRESDTKTIRIKERVDGVLWTPSLQRTATRHELPHIQIR